MRLEIKEDPTCLLFHMEEFDGYTRTVGAMSAGGYRELSRRFWREGECLGANPWHMHGEDGRLLDFISALRVAEEMAANPETFRMPEWDSAPETEWDCTGEPPF